MMTPPPELQATVTDPTHEELVIVRELLTILVILAVTGALYVLARNSIPF